MGSARGSAGPPPVKSQSRGRFFKGVGNVRSGLDTYTILRPSPVVKRYS